MAAGFIMRVLVKQQHLIHLKPQLSFIWLVGMSREVLSSALVTPSRREDEKDIVVGWMVILLGAAA